MSWPSRLVRGGMALVAAAALAGCGFEPLYGDAASGGKLPASLASVYVKQIAERSGQEMTNTLRDGFNPNGVTVPRAYELDVALSETKALLMIRHDSTASRTDITLTANWSLRRLSDNKVVTSGSSQSITGYDVLDNEYANVVSGNADLARAVRDVSADIQQRVAFYFRHPA